MKRYFVLSIALALLSAVATAEPPQSPDVAGKLQRGLEEIGSGLTQAWNEVRQSVENMGVQGRVYGRLHWDKALQGAALNVEIRDDSVIVLTGSVGSSAARQRAGELARDTIGVKNIVNELAVK